MTQQFENFVNAALDKSLASDVTLPTANKIPVYTGIGRQVTGKTTAELGLANLVEGKVPSSQLPSYVDDVLEYPNLASFPVTGESGKVYVALDTNKTYRWSGSTYVVIGSDLALGETLSTAYRGDRGKTAYDHSQLTGNPHGATTADITDSTDKRYVTDAQRTRVNTAASSGADGYLTSADWTTFNGKQNALADTITADTYGSSTQYPVITFNAKGIATGVTLQTVSVAEVSDSVFRIVDNDDATKKIAFQASGIAAGETKTITMPNANVDLGTMSSVATTDDNVLGGTGCRIEGGNNNNVSGTGSSSYLSSYQTITGTNNHAVFCRPSSGTGVFTHAGNGNTYYNHRHDTSRIGSSATNCTFYDCYGIVGAAGDVNVVYRSAGMSSGLTMYGFIPHTQVTGNGVSASPLRAVCMLQSPPALTGVPAVLVSLVSGAVQDKPPLFRNGGNGAYHDIVLNAYDTNLYSDPKYMLCLRRQVTVYQVSSTPVISVTTLGTDLNPSNLTFTVSVAVVNSYRMEITVTATDPVSPAPPIPLTYVWSAVVESTYF